MSKLDRPLNDIIRDQGQGRGRGRGRGGQRGRGFRARGGARGGFRGRGGFRSFGGAVANGTGPIRRDRTFSRPQSAPYPKPVQSGGGGTGLTAGGKIMLANLDPQITEDDCLEIFQNVGPVTKTVIHYDRHGASLGTGEVHFANKNDALRAADEYDSAQVDGRTMHVKVIANKVPNVVQRAPALPSLPPFPMPAFPASINFGTPRGRPFLRARGGFRARGSSRGRGGSFRSRGGGGGRGGSRGGAGGGSRGGGKSTPPSAADLDADIDGYFATPAGGDTEMLAAGQPSNPAVAKKK